MKQNLYLTLTALIILTVIFANRDIGVRPVPELHKVGNFTLTDSNQNLFRFDQLKGKIVVVDFIFTTCQGVCPLMTQNLKKIYEQFRNKTDVAFLSITVNPEYDTPAVLAKYSERLNINPNQWVFLTGPRDVIQTIAVNEFKIGSVDEPVFHSAYFVLVDKQGVARGYYEGSEAAQIQKLVVDIKRLRKG